MNWDAVGAMGEIAGAIAVVFSLVYLAMQIRVSNQAARDASHQEAMDQYLNAANSWSSSIETTDLYLRGMRADESLSKTELVQFRMLLQTTVTVFERIYFLSKNDRLDNWLSHQINYIRSQMANAPGFQSYYEGRKNIFSEEFRRVLENDMKGDDEYQPFGLSND